ncbi:FecR family protein [Olivibacter domesticus]|uniref:FecR family protein n=1 Tax=Olivibacter domesticus TaxID=407022 RepID=A0A1H7W3B6_OLID1|nr:FecR family protein [Olivibacter domesticus]SEM15589.1 FecR family protein [Olivibacter domesticus]
MKKASLRFTFLVTKYLNKSATAAEIEELSTLLHTLEIEEINKIMEQIYEQTDTTNPVLNLDQSQNILQNILKDTKISQQTHFSKRKYSPIYKLSIAAIIGAITFGLVFFKFYSLQKDNQRTLPIKQTSDISAGGNRATLSMANGTIILLDSANKGVLARDEGTIIKKTAEGQLAFNARHIQYDKEASIGVNTIYTPRGGQYQIILPDGSKVWLNAETSIKFPSKFIGAERRVELIGEAYFEIAKKINQPFKVVTNRIEVQVLGTAFSISGYKDETTQKTTLFDGAIKIKRGEKTQLLKPGEQSILTANNQFQLKDGVDPEVELAWKNGLFLFKDASMKEVMNQVARWYNVKVIYTGKNSKKLFNGSVSRSANLDELMSMLAFTGVAYEIKERNIIIKN